MKKSDVWWSGRSVLACPSPSGAWGRGWAAWCELWARCGRALIQPPVKVVSGRRPEQDSGLLWILVGTVPPPCSLLHWHWVAQEQGRAWESSLLTSPGPVPDGWGVIYISWNPGHLPELLREDDCLLLLSFRSLGWEGWCSACLGEWFRGAGSATPSRTSLAKICFQPFHAGFGPELRQPSLRESLEGRGAALLCFGWLWCAGRSPECPALSSVQAASAALLLSENQTASHSKFLWITQTGLAGTSAGVEPGHSSARPGVGSEFHFGFS